MGLLVIASFFYVRDKGVKMKRPTTPFILYIGIFLITVISGVNSTNTEVWLQFLAKKSPFLFMPVCFYLTRDHFAQRYYDYLNGFIVLVVLFSFGILTNYLLNAEAINIAIGKGQTLNTTIDHTEFSIYVAYAIVVSIFLYMEKRVTSRGGNRQTKLLIALFLMVFIHVLAVRSGLAVLYISGLLVALWYMFQKRSFKYLVPLIVSVILIPIMASKTFPSLKKKIDYTMWDLEQFRKGKGTSYSDSERLYSLQAGWSVAKEHMFLGVGIGDLKDECDKFYEKTLGKTLVHYPHNQYLFAVGAMGIVGLLIYLLCILGPIILLRSMMDPYFIMLTLVVLSSAMVENTLERTFSIGFYLFFALLSICHLTSKWAQPRSSSV